MPQWPTSQFVWWADHPLHIWWVGTTSYSSINICTRVVVVQEATEYYLTNLLVIQWIIKILLPNSEKSIIFLVWVVIHENVGNFLDDLGIGRQEWSSFLYFNNSRRSVKSIITLLKMNFLTKLNAWCRQIRKSIGNTKFVHLNWKFLWNLLVPKETRMNFFIVNIFFLSTYHQKVLFLVPRLLSWIKNTLGVMIIKSTQALLRTSFVHFSNSFQVVAVSL